MREAARPTRQVRRAQARKKTASPTTRFRLERLTTPLIVVAGLVAYHNAFRGPFVMDDLPAISRNTTIRTLWPPWGVLSPPPHSGVTGRPLVNLSLALNYAIGGLDVTSYHLFNLAVHILAALVIFGIVRRTLAAPGLGSPFGDRARWIATATSLLWVVHPLTSESVDYTIQRTELLMGLFFLLTLYCALRGFESPKGWRWFAAALAAFALGLGSKEVIVVAPVVVLAYDWLFWSKSFKDALGRHRRLYAGFAVVLVLFVLLVGTRLRGAFTGLGSRMSPWDYALTQCGVIAHYLRLALWPHPLTADYGGWPIATSVTTILPSLIVLVALFALTLWGLARRVQLAFLGVWFFAILGPTSSFRPISNEIAAERRMYLPLAAVVLLVVLGIQALLRWLAASRAVRLVAVAPLAAILALVTMRRNDDYRTTLSFWSDTVAKRPDNARAHMWLGNYLRTQGQSADALSHLSEAVRLQPRNTNAQNSLGAALASQGRADEAIEHYREAIRLDPQNSLGHYNLALALGQRGRTTEATEHLEAAIRLRPDFPEARRALDGFRSRANQ